MKNTCLKISMALCLLLMVRGSWAQETRSANGKIIRDSLYWTTHPRYYVSDTVHHTITTSARLKKDLPGPVRPAKIDAASARITKTNADTIPVKMRVGTKMAATTRSVLIVDSVHSRKLVRTAGKPIPDSLHKKKIAPAEQNKIRMEQSKKLFEQRADLFHSRRDAAKAKYFQQNMKADSIKMKDYLFKKKLALQQCLTATVLSEKGINKRILATEMNCDPGDSIFLNNTYKNIIVKIVPQQRVRVSGTILYQDASTGTDLALLKNYDVTLQRSSRQVTVNVGSKKNLSATPAGCDENLEADLLRSITIEVPATAILVVQTRYASTNIENAITYLKADLDNAKLTMANASQADISSRLGEVRTDNIKIANIKLDNSKLIAGNINDLTICSKLSTLQLNQADLLKLNSTNDSYSIDLAGNVSGKKDFGKFTIEKLEEGIELDGANADVKINALGKFTPRIKISSKFADLKFPLYQQENFMLLYEGSSKDVNKTAASLPPTAGITRQVTGTVNRINAKLEASAGNLGGSHAKVDIDCPFCNVVFN